MLVIGDRGRWGDGGLGAPTLWGWGAMGNSPVPTPCQSWGLGAVGSGGTSAVLLVSNKERLAWSVRRWGGWEMG